MADNKVVIEVSVEGDGEVKIQKLTKAVEDFADKGSKSMSAFGRVAEISTGVFAGQALLDGIKAVTSAVYDFAKNALVSSIKAAQEQEDAVARLNSALLATGQYTDGASKRLQEFASSLQTTTKYSDDQIIRAQALIQSLGHLDEQGLKKATLGALNLAAGLHEDLETAALQVGKATEGFAGRLSQLGLKLDENNSKSQNLDQTLVVIQKHFKDFAANEVNTFSGAMAVLTHQYEEGAKATGTAIITNQSLVNVLKVAREVLEEFQNSSSGSKQAISDFVSQGLVLAIKAAQYFVEGFRLAEIGALKLAQAAYLASPAFFLMQGDLLAAGKAAVNGVKQFQSLQVQIEKVKEGGQGFNAVQDGLTKFLKAAEDGVGKTTDASERSAAAVRNQARAVDDLTKAQEKQIEEGKRLADQAINKDPQQEFDARVAALDAVLQVDISFLAKRNEAYGVFLTERDEKEQQAIDKISAREFAAADQIIAQNQLLAEQDRFGNQVRIQNNNETLRTLLNNENISARDKIKIEEALTRQQKALDQERMNSGMAALNALASLQNAKTKELAALGKAAAIAQATIDTYKGASAAASSLAGIPYVGPALAAAAAAAFIAAGLVRVAQISGVELATGITEVPGGYANDTYPARLSSGERVVDSNTNQDLKGFLAGSNAMVSILAGILNRLNAMEMRYTVNIGTKTIVDEVQRGLQAGRSIAI